MRISDAAKQAIDVQAKTMQTQQAIAAAVLKKQAEVDKSSAQSIVQLLESAASPPSRGLDLKALRTLPPGSSDPSRISNP